MLIFAIAGRPRAKIRGVPTPMRRGVWLAGCWFAGWPAGLTYGMAEGGGSKSGGEAGGRHFSACLLSEYRPI